MDTDNEKEKARVELENMITALDQDIFSIENEAKLLKNDFVKILELKKIEKIRKEIGK